MIIKRDKCPILNGQTSELQGLSSTLSEHRRSLYRQYREQANRIYVGRVLHATSQPDNDRNFNIWFNYQTVTWPAPWNNVTNSTINEGGN